MTGMLVIASAVAFEGSVLAKEIQGQVVTVMPNTNSVTIRQSADAGQQQQQSSISDLINLQVDQKAEFKGEIKSLQDIQVGDTLKVEGDKADGQAQGGAAAYETYNVKSIEKVEGADMGQGAGMTSGTDMGAGSGMGSGAGSTTTATQTQTY